MKSKNIARIVTATAFLTFAFIVSSHAQEMGWDTDEETQRIEQEQTEEAEQGGEDLHEATDVETPPAETSGEKELSKWEELPTGYLARSYLIRQDNLGGEWQSANIFPTGADSKWAPIDAPTYESSLKSGAVDGELKGTVYGPYYENMIRVCRTAPNAGEVHIKSPSASPQWKMGQRLDRPYTLRRQLQFECLVKIN